MDNWTEAVFLPPPVLLFGGGRDGDFVALDARNGELFGTLILAARRPVGRSLIR